MFQPAKNQIEGRTFSKSILAAAVSIALGGVINSTHAAIPAGAVLEFDPGTQVVSGCLAGNFTGSSCTVGGTAFTGLEITDIGGSYFGLDTTGGGTVTAQDKVPLSMFAPLHIGTTQTSSGQHTGRVDGSESPAIDNPWNFFNNAGMHTLASPITVISDSGPTKTLDFSGWGVNWGDFGPGGLFGGTIPMGGIATLACAPADCSTGSSYTLDMDVHVPEAFASVPYTLHLEGTVAMPGPPQPAVNIQVSGGTSQECDVEGGNNIEMVADVFTPEPGDVASITWFLDGTQVAQGESVDIFVPLGSHDIGVVLETTQSGSAESSAVVNVSDTLAPELTAEFVNRKTGEPITEFNGRGTVKILLEATDVCDPAPVADATIGTSAHDGDILKIDVSEDKSKVKLKSGSPQDSVELRATARDSSGNTTSRFKALTINQ